MAGEQEELVCFPSPHAETSQAAFSWLQIRSVGQTLPRAQRGWIEKYHLG